MFNKSRRWFVLALLLLAVIGVAVSWRPSRSPEPTVFTTQRPGEPKITWHTMHTLWTFAPSKPDSSTVIGNLVADTTHLYYINYTEVGCVDKATGSSLWRYSLGLPTGGYPWQIGVSGGYLFAIETQPGGDESTRVGPFRLCCLIAANGKRAWENALTTRPTELPTVAHNLVLTPLATGEVIALRLDNGKRVWQRQMSVTHYNPRKSNVREPLSLQAEGDLCILRTGTQRILRFAPLTGKILWSHPSNFSGGRAEDMDLDKPLLTFTLRDGVLYSTPNRMQTMAEDALTGHHLWNYIRPPDSWSKTFGSCEDSPVVVGDMLLTQMYDGWVALRRTDGAPLWEQKGIVSLPVVAEARATRNSLVYQIGESDPLIGHRQRVCRSLNYTDKVVAFDPSTSGERWRWQLDLGSGISRLVPDQGRLFIATDDRLVAVEPGESKEIPSDSSERTELARKMLASLTDWYPESSLLQTLRTRLPFLHIHPPKIEKVSDWQAEFTLLQLGEDSIEPIMTTVEHQIKEMESGTTPTIFMRTGYRDSPFQRNLDLLFDLDARSVEPALIAYLDKAQKPYVRSSVAELLIRWGDQKSLPALFRYVQKCDDSQENAGLDALYFLCRLAPMSGKPGPDTVTQEDLTAYLMAHLSDPKAPAWLRRMARFELLNDRGEAARKAALATFSRPPSVALMPTLQQIAARNDVIQWDKGKLMPFQPLAKTQDATGRWWGVFQSDYFGDNRLWFVQSGDGKRWEKPTYGVETADRSGNLHYKLSYRQGTLQVGCWSDGQPATQCSVSIRDLYRDSDGDGVPDLVERLIGTNPNRSDSMGSGIPDGINKNPLYKRHKLTQEEAIYQAVIEALCQYGETRNLRSSGTFNSQEIATPFDITSPLILPVPDDSKGVEILGHPKAVLCYTLKTLQHSHSFGDQGTNRPFSAPMFGLDGMSDVKLQRDTWENISISTDTEKKISFHDHFPYQLSPDGNRARICYKGAGFEGYDVEVRKIEGQWLPVECRHIWSSFSNGIRQAVGPVRSQDIH